MNFCERFRSKLHIRNDLIRCALAEFFCTALLVFGGCCSRAQQHLSKSTKNDWFGVAMGWGLAFIFAVYGAFNISGGHLNPAVSFSFFTLGRLSALRCAVYSVAQILGGFVGALFTFLIYYDALKDFHESKPNMDTAHIFATYITWPVSPLGGVVDQIMGTALLCLCICITTDKNNKIPRSLQPLLIGLVLTTIGLSIGMNTGYAVNPARDLGPRLLTLCAGWGWKTFTHSENRWFWVPILCPLIGGVIGAWIYELCLGIQMVDPNEDIQSAYKKPQTTDTSNEKVIKKTSNTLVLSPHLTFIDDIQVVY